MMAVLINKNEQFLDSTCRKLNTINFIEKISFVMSTFKAQCSPKH